MPSLFQQLLDATRRARYRGQRKNVFDLRRAAIVHNLHQIARRHQKQTA